MSTSKPPMATAPLPAEITTPPSSALRAAAAQLGVKTLNCKTCSRGNEDSDGEPGATFYCGMTCSKHDLPETYLEDSNVDIETEKACWHPDFWKSETPDITAMLDGSDESLARAADAWHALLERVMPQPQDAQ